MVRLPRRQPRRWLVLVSLALVLAWASSSFAAHPIASAASDQRVLILMYHYIRTGVPPSDRLGQGLSIAPADLDAQARALVQRGYVSVTLDDLVAAQLGQAALPPRAVALTFDDGYADFYTAAWPILQRYGLSATAYIISGKLGQPGYLACDQLRELADAGVTIAAHSVTHPRLTALSDAALAREMRESRRQLEDCLGQPVRHFAYPSGVYDARVRQAAAEAGYLTATTTRYGVARPDLDRLTLPRLRVFGGISLPQFVGLLATAER